MRGLATQQILEEQYGKPTYLGTITVAVNGTAKSNLDTAVPFTITPGSRLLIQPSGACTVKIGDSAVVAAATGCVSLTTSEKFYCCLKTADSCVSLYFPAAGGANVFLME